MAVASGDDRITFPKASPPPTTGSESGLSLGEGDERRKHGKTEHIDSQPRLLSMRTHHGGGHEQHGGRQGGGSGGCCNEPAKALDYALLSDYLAGHGCGVEEEEAHSQQNQTGNSYDERSVEAGYDPSFLAAVHDPASIQPGGRGIGVPSVGGASLTATRLPRVVHRLRIPILRPHTRTDPLLNEP